MREAARLLRPCGRYAIREMCLRDGVGGEVRKEVERALTGVVHHGVRPLPSLSGGVCSKKRVSR